MKVQFWSGPKHWLDAPFIDCGLDTSLLTVSFVQNIDPLDCYELLIENIKTIYLRKSPQLTKFSKVNAARTWTNSITIIRVRE